MLKDITDFEFIVVFLTIIISILVSPFWNSVKLQSTAWDIIKAYKEIDAIKVVYIRMFRKNSTKFSYLQAEQMSHPNQGAVV